MSEEMEIREKQYGRVSIDSSNPNHSGSKKSLGVNNDGTEVLGDSASSDSEGDVLSDLDTTLRSAGRRWMEKSHAKNTSKGNSGPVSSSSEKIAAGKQATVAEIRAEMIKFSSFIRLPTLSEKETDFLEFLSTRMRLLLKIKKTERDTDDEQEDAYPQHSRQGSSSCGYVVTDFLLYISGL
jgi:hypothetical protein